MNGAQFHADTTFEADHLDKVVPIVGPLNIGRVSLDRDRNHATDLRAQPRDIAVRLRRPGATKYKHQFTIRSSRSSGTLTELDKIRRGDADWLFYGHLTPDRAAIFPWMVIDLDALRLLFMLYPEYTRKPVWNAAGHGVSGFGTNPDGTEFVWFQRLLLPVDVTVAASLWADEPVQRALDLGGPAVDPGDRWSTVTDADPWGRA